MNMEFKRKMPTPQAIKEMYPITPELAERKKIDRCGAQENIHRRG